MRSRMALLRGGSPTPVAPGTQGTYDSIITTFKELAQRQLNDCGFANSRLVSEILYPLKRLRLERMGKLDEAGRLRLVGGWSSLLGHLVAPIHCLTGSSCCAVY